ncbi:MAG: UDP-N-acetylmuramate dehydrogenase [Zoogloeaceae bacterium]|jgi:UDP-N-acetylmuramate dehydrogenase|nr:UDP-N-acetylmuramate dehydrogenase [Zoogloeaceae bacterium]
MLTLPHFVSSEIDLRPLNTLALPGRAEFFAHITKMEQMDAIRKHPELAEQRRFILGGGSNLVLSGDFPGLILYMRLMGRECSGESAAHYYVSAAAGENWHEFVNWTLSIHRPGLENLSWIPGSVGAAPVQNIGAYGVEAGEFLSQVEAFDLESGKLCRFSAADCAFAYRDSLFKREGWHLSGRYAITRVVFCLPKRWRPRTGYAELAEELARRGADNPAPADIAGAVSALRRRKLPDMNVLPNSGSFFQNPLVSAELAGALASAHPSLPRYPQPDGRVKLAAAWLIENAGWKGRNLGAAGMYEKQALVLVNRGGATFKDVQNLTRAVREAVFARFGIHLEPEPVFL